MDAAAVGVGGVAADFGVAVEGYRPVAIDAAAVGGGVAGNGAAIEGQPRSSVVVDAAAGGGGGVVGDGAAVEGHRPAVVDAAAGGGVASGDGEVAGDGEVDAVVVGQNPVAEAGGINGAVAG